MTKKILSLIFACVLLVSVFSGCSLLKDKGEEATLKSDSDSASVKEDISFADEQIAKANSAKSAATADAFNKNLLNPEINVVSFYGASSITIEHSEKLEKTVSIKTPDTVTVNSPVSSVVLLQADKGFTANAKVDSIIIEGEGITCDLKNETGSVYITGKDCTVNIHEGSVEKVLVRNSTAIITNYSDNSIEVTLTNGTKVTVEKNKTYDVKPNLIRRAD